jgi:hypothetical protein
MVTTVFITSFVALCAMIGIKVAETRAGHFSFWTNTIEVSDEKMHVFLKGILKRYQFYKKVAYLFIFEFLPSYSYELLIKMKDYVQKRYYESQSTLRGNKRMLRSSGSVSSFLQDIGTKKEEVDTTQESVLSEQTTDKDILKSE